jgi:hypothetical protein
MLVKLASDSNTDVRLAVAKNPRVPLGLLIILAADKSIQVRLELAENQNLPPQILTALARDSDPYIARIATRTLESQKRASLPHSA